MRVVNGIAIGFIFASGLMVNAQQQPAGRR